MMSIAYARQRTHILSSSINRTFILVFPMMASQLVAKLMMSIAYARQRTHILSSSINRTFIQHTGNINPTTSAIIANDGEAVGCTEYKNSSTSDTFTPASVKKKAESEFMVP